MARSFRSRQDIMRMFSGPSSKVDFMRTTLGIQAFRGQAMAACVLMVSATAIAAPRPAPGKMDYTGVHIGNAGTAVVTLVQARNAAAIERQFTPDLAKDRKSVV